MNTPSRSPDILVDGLHFPEGPRWRQDRLYFSDILGKKVRTVDLAGRLETLAEVAAMPSGLGFLPDGTLLVVAVDDGQLLALRDGGLEPYADLFAVAGLPCNDMVVDARGRAFVGSFSPGVDESQCPGPGNMPAFSSLVLACSDDGGPASARRVADRMTCPNGAAVTADSATLIVAESFGFRLSAFDIEADGTLTNRRVWADLGVPPDGICLDAEGCAWVAIPYFQYGGPGGYVRVREGGELVERIDVEDYAGYACMLGGAERRNLFLCESAVLGLPRHPGDGRIRVVDVDVPGVGYP